MNEPQLLELEKLKRRQQALARELTSLDEDIRRLELRLATPVLGAAASTRQDPVSLSSSQPQQTADAAAPPKAPPVIPASLPIAISGGLPVAPTPGAAAATARLTPETGRTESVARPNQSPPSISPAPPSSSHPATPPPLSPAPPATKPRASFELRLGTYWLVRIGAVLILTGLVFFGNLAYQKMGAVGKLSLLYLASGLMLGAGAWWQRRSVKESLGNYAQVLFAGGMAAVYFTTYAAHHAATLRVITSPLLDGALLLAWAGFMAWIADRKQSELLALFAVGLAYYTSVITPVSGFTLFSNLVLTLAAMFFLLRNRWAGLSWASLIATYAAYAYWRFHHGGEGWRWATAAEGLWFGASFLWSYWLVFTLAVFLSRHEGMAGGRRAAFLTFNNGAMFALFILTMLQVDAGGLWRFCLGYGTVLLALAELSRRFLASEPLSKNTYLVQGLVLVTVGLVSKFLDTPRTLALVLAAESVILFVLGTLRKSVLLQTGAYLAGAMAIGWGVDGLERDDPRGLWLGVAMGALMAVNACWAEGRMGWADRREFRPVPAYFTVLALVMWIATTWFNTRPDNFPVVLAIEAVVLTASVYALRVREFALLGQGLLVLAHLAWLTRFVGGPEVTSWWNPVLLIAVTLGLSHWWQRQRIVESVASLGLLYQTLYGLAVVAVVLVWLEPRCSPPEWLALTSLLAIGTTAYAVATRNWPLALCGQLFLAVSAGQFAIQLARVKPAWPAPLAPVAALGLLSFATWNWFARRPDLRSNAREPLLQLAMGYRWLALVMSIWWVGEYIHARERVWVYLLLGLVSFVFAGARRTREGLLFSAVFSVAGLVTLWATLPRSTLVYLPNVLAICALLGQQQIARHLGQRYVLPRLIPALVIAVGGLSLWRLESEWLLLHQMNSYLTAAWSVLALVLFATGVALREKMYRWMGLAILAAALGRVVVFDVWKWETVYRVLSFLALGIVLVVLGFIYNKYQEKIRQWL